MVLGKVGLNSEGGLFDEGGDALACVSCSGHIGTILGGGPFPFLRMGH